MLRILLLLWGMALALVASVPALAGVTYYHTDHLGSVVARSNAFGAVVARQDYRPYGGPGGSSLADFGPGYTGHLYDKSLKLNYMKARFYDPLIGRFYSADPVGFQSNNPISFNRYAYANNNPYKYVDPTGEYIESAFDVFSISLGVSSFVNNLSQGNYGWAAVDALGVALDSVALALPIPGGAGVAIGGARSIDLRVEPLRITDPARLLPSPEAATLRYPLDNGFLNGEFAAFTLLPGSKIDRYEPPTGRFFADEGTPFGRRSLPFNSYFDDYTSYEVIKPFTVEAGVTAPWFCQPGGGIQYFSGYSAENLILDGFIE